METEKLTLTIPEAAKILGISRGLAYRMAQERRLPIIQFGKRKLVPKKSILNLLENPDSELRLQIENRNTQMK